MRNKTETPSILIDGHAHNEWLQYSLDSDLFTPADAWTMSLGMPADAIPSWLRPWAEVEVRLGDDPVMVGRLDTLRKHISATEAALTLAGRDGAGILLDCSAPLFVRREVTLTEVCDLVVRPLGIERIDVRAGKAMFKKVTVEPGMTAWEALRQAAETAGLWPWFTPDGTLRVAAPDDDAPVSAELILELPSPRQPSMAEDTSKGAAGETASFASQSSHPRVTDEQAATARTNVLSLAVEENAARRYSEITVLGQTVGTENAEADNTIRAVVRDEDFPFSRPLVRNGGYVDGLDGALTQARKLNNDGLLDSLTVTAKVYGHRNAAGVLWEPGQRVHVHAPLPGLEQDMLLTRRTFTGGPDGSLTVLTLKPWGCWTVGAVR